LQTALDDKVPYTGATANVDLGGFSIKASMVQITGINSGGTGGVLNIKKGNTRVIGGDDAANNISLWAETAAFGFNDWTAGNTRDAKFSLLSITNNATRTYTLPNLSGTLALLSDIPSLTGFVPYTGATQDVDLGEFELKAGQVEFDQTPTGTAGVGVMRWNDSDGTVDLGLKGGNVTLQVGQEQILRVVNKTGANLLESQYRAVRIRLAAEGGSQGQRLAVVLAQGNNDANSTDTIGIVTENITDNQEGFICTSGIIRGINTTGSLQGETWADGDIIYLSPTIAGAITTVKPTAPNHSVILGYVIYAHNVNGKIFVKCDNGYELGELHDVYVPTPSNNDGIFWNTANSRYQNNSIAGVLGYTPISGSGTSGQVAYWNGTSSQTGSNNLFWDAANARLGIGTNVPATPLHIVGNSTFDGNNNHLINRNSAYYNTSDIVTNFEKVTIGWVSNVFNIDFSRGGSTSFRDVQLSVGGSGLLIRGSGSNIAGRITASYATNVGGVFGVTGSVTGTGSSFQYGSGVLTTISAGGTVPTSAFWISPYVASLGTGFNALLDVGTNSAANGGGTHTRYFAVLNNGNAILQAGGTFTDSGQRLQVQGDAFIKGSGATSATTGLQVQNSAGNNMFRIANNGAISLGNSSLRASIFTFTTNQGVIDFSGTNLSFYNSTSNLSATSGAFAFGGDSFFQTTGNQLFFSINMTFVPTSGTATFASLNLSPGINQTGGANGITRGLYVIPTLTAAADWRSIEWSNNSGWGLYGAGTANNYLGGNLGIGSTGLTNVNLRIEKNIEGSTGSYGVLLGSQIRSGVTSQALGYTSNPSIQNTAFTLSQLRHFYAVGIPSAGSATIINQSGFYAEASLTGATNNFGFYGDIPNATNRWNLYMVGTADNYLAGKLLIGTTTVSTFALDVNGTARVSGASTFARITATTSGIELDYNSGILYHAGGSGSYYQYIDGVSYTFRSRTATGSLIFATQDIERMRLTAAGRLLLGTTTESTYLLDVNGTSRFSQQSIFFAQAYVSKVLNSATIVNTSTDASVLLFAPTTTNNYGGVIGWAEGGVILAASISAYDDGSGGALGLSFATGNNTALAERLKISSIGAATFSSSVKAGGGSINASAILQADSTTQGFLPPRMTNAQRTAIGSPAVGLIVYCTDMVEGLYVYKSTGWTFVI
jgi:hypothetical protein